MQLSDLKDFIKTSEYREIEKYFLAEATKIKLGKVDRNKEYIDQGIESHVRELASEAIERVCKNLRDTVEGKVTKKIRYR